MSNSTAQLEAEVARLKQQLQEKEEEIAKMSEVFSLTDYVREIYGLNQQNAYLKQRNEELEVQLKDAKEKIRIAEDSYLKLVSTESERDRKRQRSRRFSGDAVGRTKSA